MVTIKRKKKAFCSGIVLITVLLFFHTFFFEIKKVRGSSMEDTLKEGDFVFIFKAAYGIKLPSKNKYLIRWAFPKADDIIVYRKGGHFTVKRCAGIAGMSIYFSFKSLYDGSTDYKMTVGGRTLGLSAMQFRTLSGRTEKYVQKIPENAVLALGDNAEKSYDSRDYGFVSADSIYGKVFLWK